MRPAREPLNVDRGGIRFEDVRFGYEDGREILKGLSVDIPPGTSCAIVGPSGAGKSTIARLLYRFYDPQSGRILIDGQDIAAVTQASLREAIGIVPQDTVLFNDTLGYNIGYGRDRAEPGRDRRRRHAARRSSVSSRCFRIAMNSMVGERGLKLSGGEKQRVAIARTLAQEPADPGARRSDQRARQPDRAGDPGDAGPRR